MDLAYVGKLARDNKGVKYPLVRQDLFDRTVDARRIKTKDCREMVRAFFSMIKKRIDRHNFGSTREQNLQENLKTMQS